MRSRLAALLLLVITLSGCITIEEHYTFKKNGSGSMEYVIDMSVMKELMDSMEGDFGEEGEDGKEGSGGEDLDMDLTENVDALKGISGISGVKVDDKEDWVRKIKFKFKDLDALNKALNVLMPDSTGTPHTFFRWEGNTLVRTNNRHALELGEEMGADENAEDEADMKGLLESMKYRYSFAFRNDISDVAVANGVQRTDDGTRKVALATDWSVITEDPDALDLRISLDR